MDDTLLGLGLGILGIGTNLIVPFLQETGMMSRRTSLLLLGLSSVACYAAAAFLLFPLKWWVIVIEIILTLLASFFVFWAVREKDEKERQLRRLRKSVGTGAIAALFTFVVLQIWLYPVASFPVAIGVGALVAKHVWDKDKKWNGRKYEKGLYEALKDLTSKKGK